MADTPAVVYIGENSPEKVALDLMRIIADIEGKSLALETPIQGHQAKPLADRAWVHSTYLECHRLVRGLSPK